MHRVVVAKRARKLPLQALRVAVAEPQPALLEEGGVVSAERNGGEWIEVRLSGLGAEDVDVPIDEGLTAQLNRDAHCSMPKRSMAKSARIFAPSITLSISTNS